MKTKMITFLNTVKPDKSKDNFIHSGSLENFLDIKKTNRINKRITTNLSANQNSERTNLNTHLLTVEEVAKVLSISVRAVQKNCKSGKYQTTTTTGRGGTRYLIALSSLPIIAQKKYAEKQAERESEQAKQNYQPLITPAQSISEATNLKLAYQRQVVAQALGTPSDNMQVTDYKKLVAKTNGIDLATLYRWIKKHTETEELIVNKVINTKCFEIDFSEFRKFSSAALDWAVGRRMTYPAESIDNTYVELEKEALKKGWKIGSLKRFYVAMGRIPEALIIAACEGRRGLDNKIAPIVERNLNCYSPLELICGDQMISDYYCYNQYGEIVTPEFYVWIDMGTSMVVGIAMTTGRYNKYLIGESLKQVCSYGIPKEIYTDNGKPELSKHLKEILADLQGCSYTDETDIKKINGLHKKAKPRNSKAKPIESYFGHIQKRLLNITEGRGYKKYDKSELDLLRSEHLKKAIKQGELMSLEEFSGCVLEAVSWWNSHYNKSRKLVAQEAFFKGLEENPRPQLSDEILEYMFLDRKTPTVRNSSVNITIEKESCRFFSEKLALYQGQKIEVRWSPIDLSKVYLLDNGVLIDIANYKGKINPKSNKDLVQALKEKQEVIKIFENLRKSYIDKFNGKIKKLTPVTKVVTDINKKVKAKNAIVITADERDALLDKVLGI